MDNPTQPPAEQATQTLLVFILTPEEANLVGSSLNEMPRKLSDPLIQKLTAQSGQQPALLDDLTARWVAQQAASKSAPITGETP